jgi:hypothetical protein
MALPAAGRSLSLLVAASEYNGIWCRVAAASPGVLCIEPRGAGAS